jgi:hypothetical protein
MSEITLPKVRLSFPKVFTAEAFTPGDKPKFSATFLIPKGSALEKKVVAAAIAALDTKFPGKGKTLYASIAGNRNKCGVQDGDAYEYDGYAGHTAVKASNTIRPTVVGADRSPLLESDGKVYAGCYVNAIVEFFGYDNTGKGLSATLKGLQFAGHGDAFTGGGVASADQFEVIDEDSGTVDDLT